MPRREALMGDEERVFCYVPPHLRYAPVTVRSPRWGPGSTSWR